MARSKKAAREPIILEGRMLATSWWGKAWNTNLEAYSDYENRLPRARSYVRAGRVVDLKIEQGIVRALVQGTRRSPYKVAVQIAPLSAERFDKIKGMVGARIENLEALVKGEFPEELANIFTDLDYGLFPSPDEIRFGCSCPDWAYMCKHVGAVLYGIGARLDTDPLLFFTLRSIDMQVFLQKTIDERLEGMLERAAKPGSRVLDPGAVRELFNV
ncbi:MAG: hypothetical protein QM296_12110 [Bacillota bacterium]|nr:hypothetical protein [Bacillota bacterium]